MRVTHQAARRWRTVVLGVALTGVMGILASSAWASVTLESPWAASGPGTVSVVSDGSTPPAQMTYLMDPAGIATTRTWTFSTTAGSTGVRTLSYDDNGFYAYFEVRAFLDAFVTHNGVTTYTSLVNVGPAICCTAPSSGFDYTGDVSLSVQSGDTYGFTVGGSNRDENNDIHGTLTIGLGPPPSVTLTTPPTGTPTYTYGETVDASYSCTAGAGGTISTCAGPVANGSAINTTSVGSNSFTVTATDTDGQSTSVTNSYNVVPLPPTVSLVTPPTGTPTYTYGQVVDASYSCTAGAGSSISTCAGPVANGSAISTTSVGSNSFTVTATDADSQSTSVTNSYNVVAASTSLKAWPQLIEFEPFAGIGSGVVAATLTSGGHPVSGQTIYFTAGSTALCHATTNAAGYAICPISGANESLVTSINYYKASYSTTTDYTGSTATTAVVTLF